MDSESKTYINEQEAHYRYGYSRAWFQRCRWAGNGPPFLKFRGKVLYPLEETDSWFKSHGLIKSTSEFVKEGATNERHNFTSHANCTYGDDRTTHDDSKSN